jgi:hypothetical protein
MHFAEFVRPFDLDSPGYYAKCTVSTSYLTRVLEVQRLKARYEHNEELFSSKTLAASMFDRRVHAFDMGASLAAEVLGRCRSARRSCPLGPSGPTWSAFPGPGPTARTWCPRAFATTTMTLHIAANVKHGDGDETQGREKCAAWHVTSCG